MLSEKIYTLRRKNRLSQEQLAERIGVSRQAISKWEGGLSTPELDKLKALSECFQITIDELTNDKSSNNSSDTTEQKKADTANKLIDSRIGLALRLMGAICLVLFGILMIIQPSTVQQINESSVITINGTGILILFFILFMVIGIILILKKK